MPLFTIRPEPVRPIVHEQLGQQEVPHDSPEAPHPEAHRDTFYPFPTQPIGGSSGSAFKPLEIPSIPAKESKSESRPENKFTQLLKNPIENIRSSIIEQKIPAERKMTISEIWKLTEKSEADPAKLESELKKLKGQTVNAAEKKFIDTCIKHKDRLSPLDTLLSYLHDTVEENISPEQQKTISDVADIERKTAKSPRLTIIELNKLLLSQETLDSEKDLIRQTIKHYQAKELFPAMLTGLTVAQLIHRNPVEEILNRPWLSAEKKGKELALKENEVQGIIDIAQKDRRTTLTPEEIKKVGKLEAEIGILRKSADVSDRVSKEVHEREQSLRASVDNLDQVRKELEVLLKEDLTPSDRKYVSERLELLGAVGNIIESDSSEDFTDIKLKIDNLRQKRNSSINPEVITLYNKTIQVEEARLHVLETLQKAAADYIDNPGVLGVMPNFRYLAGKEALRGQEIKPSLEMTTQLENTLKSGAVAQASKNFQEKMERRLAQIPELAKRLTFESSLLTTLGRDNPQFVEKREGWEKQIGNYEALHEQGKELVRVHEGALVDAKTSLETTSDAISKLQKQVEESGAEPTEQMSEELSNLRDIALKKQEKIDQLAKELEDLKGIADAKQYNKWANFYERQKYGMMMSEVTSQTYQASHQIRELQAEKQTLEKAVDLPQGMNLETKTARLTEITTKLTELIQKREQLALAFDAGMRYMRQFDIDGVKNYPDRDYLSHMSASLKDILGFSSDYAKPTKEYYMENVLQRDGYSSVESMQLLLEKIKSQPNAIEGLQNLAKQLVELAKNGYKNPDLSEALAGDIGHILAQLSGVGTLANTGGRLFAERRIRDVLAGTLTEGPGAPNFEQGIPPELIGLVRALQQAPYLIGAAKGAMGTGGTISQGGHLLAAGIPVLSQILGAGGAFLQTALEKRVAQSAPRDTEKYLAAVQTLLKTGDLKAAAKDFIGRKLMQSGGESVRELYQYGFMAKLKDLVTLKSFRRWWNNASGKERAFRIFGQAVVPLATVAGAVGIAIATGGLALIPIIIAAASGAGTALGVSLGAKYFGDTAWRGTDDKIFKERNQELLENEFNDNAEAEAAFNRYAANLGLSEKDKQQFKKEAFDELSGHMLEAKKTNKSPSKNDIKKVMDDATEKRQLEMARRLTIEMDSLGVEQEAGSMRIEQTPKETIADLESVLFSGDNGRFPEWSSGFTEHLAVADRNQHSNSIAA
jgi:hypothetical protein